MQAGMMVGPFHFTKKRKKKDKQQATTNNDTCSCEAVPFITFID